MVNAGRFRPGGDRLSHPYSGVDAGPPSGARRVETGLWRERAGRCLTAKLRNSRIPRVAFRAAQQPRPIDYRHPRAVLSDGIRNSTHK